MKKRLKRITAVLSAVICTVPMAALELSASGYYAGQQHTWRMVEKTSAIGLEWYSSVAENQNGYTFGTSQKGSLIVNASNFQSTYSTSLQAFTASYFSPPKINGEGYLSYSTWYTPTTVTSFSMGYSYETSNNAVITPIFVLVGDVNLDHYVNNLDADYLAQYLANRSSGTATLTERQTLAADANSDGVVNVRDCAAIASFSSGNTNHF